MVRNHSTIPNNSKIVKKVRSLLRKPLIRQLERGQKRKLLLDCQKMGAKSPSMSKSFLNNRALSFLLIKQCKTFGLSTIKIRAGTLAEMKLESFSRKLSLTFKKAKNSQSLNLANCTLILIETKVETSHKKKCASLFVNS